MNIFFCIKPVTHYLLRQHVDWPLKGRLTMETRGFWQRKSLSEFGHSNKLLISFPSKQRDYLDLERKAPAGKFLFASWS